MSDTYYKNSYILSYISYKNDFFTNLVHLSFLRFPDRDHEPAAHTGFGEDFNSEMMVVGYFLDQGQSQSEQGHATVGDGVQDPEQTVCGGTQEAGAGGRPGGILRCHSTLLSTRHLCLSWGAP